MQYSKYRMYLSWAAGGLAGVAILFFDVPWYLAVPAAGLLLVPVFTLVRG